MGPAPCAIVFGNLDVVRPLALAGRRCALVAGPANPARHSRRVERLFDSEQADLIDALVAFAEREAEPPLLFVEHDRGLLRVLAHYEQLAAAMRLPPLAPECVEAMLDKVRFQEVAEQAGLPVPAGRIIRSSDDAAELGFPVLVKPALRELWAPVMDREKAVLVASRAELERLLERLAPLGAVPLLAQRLIPGDEQRVESWHAYLSASGAVLGEFTGRKVRTRPASFGMSTALVTTDAPDVRALGREVVERLGVTGPVKVDFKRAPSGALLLFEVNPRFTLWAHPGALAGANLPDLAFRDLTGEPPGPPALGCAGIRWCDPLQDLAGVRERGGSTWRWVGDSLRTPARSAGSLDDPLPLLRGLVWPQVARRLHG